MSKHPTLSSGQDHSDALQTLLSSISQGVYLVGPDGRISLFNDRLCELLDISRAFFEQHPTLEEIKRYQMQRGDFGSDTSLVDEDARDYVLAGGKLPTPSQFLRTTRDGRTLEVRSTQLPSGGMVRTFADVTDYVQAEAARKRLNQLLFATQAIAQMGGWEIDLEAGQVTWTEGVYRIFDTTPQAFIPTLANTSALFTENALPVVEASYSNSSSIEP